MLNLLKQLKEFLIDFKEFKTEVLFRLKKKTDPLDVKLMRHLLNSIDLSDMRDKERTETEHKEFLSQVASFYPTIIEQEIKQMIIAQEEFMAREVSNIEQFNFARGTINGLMLLLDKYKGHYNEYKGNFPDKEEMDKTNLFPEI